MKPLLYLIAFWPIAVSGQNQSDEQLVKGVVIAFQKDFNDGSFKDAINYTTEDWEHLNPFGGITKGRNEVLKEFRLIQ
jgi:hypothetical protein